MSIVQCSLNQIPLGKRCKVTQLNSTGSIRTRLQDIGLVQGTELDPRWSKAARGDPVAYLIRGTVIAIRDKDSRSILVEHDEE